MNLKDSTSCKRVQTLCRLFPSNASCVKYLKFNNGRCITVFSAGNKLLHIMENYKIIFIVNMGSCILNVLDYVDERNEIWVVTKDGKLWAIPISLQGNEQTKQQTSSQATKESPNREIFAELLADNAHSEDQTQNVPVFSNIHQCSHDYVIYWEEGLQDVVIGPHHIITCSCSNDGDLRLTVYPWIEQNVERKREMASSFLYQTVMPRGTCNHDNNNVARLLYVSPSEQLLFKCANSTLNQQLFSLLFSSQSGGNCPVILVGLQSGLVGYIRVGVKNEIPQIPTLYHLEQPVLSIFPVCRKPPSPKGVNPDTTETADTLCILGTLGKLVLITQDNSKGLRDSTVVQEYHVPGPIVCAAVSNNLRTLFYSTLKEMYAVQLELKTDKGTSELHLPSSLSPTTLNISKVLALSTDDANSMICLKTDGRVLLVPQSLAEGISQSSSPSGDQIKKHLGEIHEKASQVKNLRDEIRQLDEVIKQLNSVTQVLCEILRNREPQNETTFQESGISFKVGVDYEAQGTSLNPRVILRCELKNSTKFPFSHNWSLVVQVDTSQPWFNEDCSVRATMNHSVSLSPASSHHISIPMEDALSYLTPIHISCYVCFGLKELLPVFLRDYDPALAEEGFSVLVSRVEMNILHFLRKQETCSSVTHQHRHPTHLLQSTLKSINTTWSPNKVSEPVQETSPEFSTFSIELSKEAVDLIQTQVQDVQLCKDNTESFLKPKPDGSNHGECKYNISSQEACVLHFILHGSRKYLYCDNTKYPNGHVVARTPKEEVVKFQVVDQVGTTQGIEGLEVRVHTSSQALGCSVHSSLLKGLKPILQRTPEQNASVPVGGLQKQLIKLKELQTSLDLVRPSFQSEESMEENTTRDRSIQKLISIYGELRKIPTIIP